MAHGSATIRRRHWEVPTEGCPEGSAVDRGLPLGRFCMSTTCSIIASHTPQDTVEKDRPERERPLCSQRPGLEAGNGLLPTRRHYTTVCQVAQGQVRKPSERQSTTGGGEPPGVVNRVLAALTGHQVARGCEKPPQPGGAVKGQRQDRQASVPMIRVQRPALPS